MTQDQIEKHLKWAARYGMSALDLGRALTAPPHDLTPPEATQVMDAFKRKYPKVIPALAQQRAANAAQLNPPPAKPQPRTVRKSVLNRSAVRAFALKVSKEKRAAKFSRVSESFIDAVEAEVMSRIRALGGDLDIRPDDGSLLNASQTTTAVLEFLDQLTARVVTSKVHRHPTVGMTLKD